MARAGTNRLCSLVVVVVGLGACSSPTSSTENDHTSVALATQALTRTKFHRVPQPANDYALFETLQVRPLALSPDGKLLFAANTPDNRLEVFKVTCDGLEAVGSVAVGLEPIAVAARTSSEVWVANHLSDSVSIVRVGPRNSLKVTRTLWVGDEPRDIVFGGPSRNRAFITTAHRGQNSPDDPDLFNPDSGRADVWVFDANDLGAAVGGERLTKLTLFADTPRALAVSADGSRVYAAPFFSGNQTTTASADAVRHVYADRMDPDNTNEMTYLGMKQRLTGRIVKWRPGEDGHDHWLDAEGRVFDDWIRVSLPDYDVFTIDASADPPVVLPQTYAHVGTSIFNMAVNPVSGVVYVANTEAHNDVRFEGHNPTLPVTTVRGNNVTSRISVIDPAAGTIVHNDMNAHVVAGVGDPFLSRAFPQDVTVSADGTTLFVVAQGSGKVAVYDTAELEAGATRPPSVTNQISLSAGGPSGVVLDEANDRAYVLTRFDDGISTVSLRSRREIAHVQMFNPEPPDITDGRRFLYDATLTSENGTQACGGCHIGGDFDGLAWDLGNPGGLTLPITTLAAAETDIWTFPPSILKQFITDAGSMFDQYQTLKGPMTTQSMRGLDNHGSMHWRGDRNGAVEQDGTPVIDPGTDSAVVSAQPNLGMFDEFRAFEEFNVAFPGLVGRAEMLPADDMAAFTRFALEITYPPNPIRHLDDSLTSLEQQGRDIYFQTNTDGSELPVDGLHNCNGCHTLDPNGNAGFTDHPGFFGTSGRLSFENLPQVFKVAHLRNAYQKVGMFASSPDMNRTLTAFEYDPATGTPINPPRAAVRGYGYQPDGAVGVIEHHLSGRGFVRTTANPGGIPTFTFDADTGERDGIDPSGFAVRRAINSFLLAYDSNMKPIVGQQVTLAKGCDAASANARIALMVARANAGDCDLVVKGRVAGRERGYVYVDGLYLADDSRTAPLSAAALRALIGTSTTALTFTCAPAGSGFRIGIDRDADGYADGDELAAGTDPASADCHP